MASQNSFPSPLPGLTGASRSGLTVLGERALSRAARALWQLAERHNTARPVPPTQPKWAPAPLLRSATRTRPPLGWPRETDSLCPDCVKELRAELLSGQREIGELINGHFAEVKAQIVEEDGQILMKKDCPKHGPVQDVLSHHPSFSARIEQLFIGRDYHAPDPKLRNHGTSSVKYGRGSVLTVDLTNRCNMMCEACFMDANQVGHVHELDWETITEILDNALTVKPRRQLSVQFSGGEPTLSPHFLKAIRYARDVGYFCVQCASNGIRFAQEPDLCRQAKAAGLRLCYLQFDGTSNEAHAFRRVGNLFDVKRQAIDNLAAAGIDVVLVVTVVRGVNDDQVGKIVQFAIDNADKVTVVSFQPVSFSGRDEDITDERRQAQRYTLSLLAHDLRDQLGLIEPMRDWFPLSAMNPFSDVADLLLDSNAEFGALKCGCHPNCGIGTPLLVHKKNKTVVPVAQFLNLEQLLRDVQQIADAGHGRKTTLAKMGLAILRNFRADQAPPGYGVAQLVKQLLSQMGAGARRIGETEGDAKEFEWRFLFVAGMWFQDLWTYDFRRTEMCIIPYGTQEGEISFCAYNTGIGWRYLVEKMHQTATVAEWHRKHGRHSIYAKGQKVDLEVASGAPGSSPGQKLPKPRRLPLVG